MSSRKEKESEAEERPKIKFQNPTKTKMTGQIKSEKSKKNIQIPQ